MCRDFGRSRQRFGSSWDSRTRKLNSRGMRKRMYSPEELANRKNMKRQIANKIEFDRALMNALKEQCQVDVWLKAGDQTDPIPAHKLILVAMSKVFRNILEPDDFKASLSKETITLSEMKHDELKTFLKFIYKGSLPDTKLVQHVRVLYVAADKYDIPHLQDLCRKQLIVSVNRKNVFDLLELAKIHSDKILEHGVSKFITYYMEEISLSSKFRSFVKSNPALTVQMIRTHVRLNRLKKYNSETAMLSRGSTNIHANMREVGKKI